jgi:hypothetical protein
MCLRPHQPLLDQVNEHPISFMAPILTLIGNGICRIACVCVYVCVFTYVCVCVCVCVCVFVCFFCVCVCVLVYVSVYVCVRRYGMCISSTVIYLPGVLYYLWAVEFKRFERDQDERQAEAIDAAGKYACMSATTS